LFVCLLFFLPLDFVFEIVVTQFATDVYSTFFCLLRSEPAFIISLAMKLVSMCWLPARWYAHLIHFHLEMPGRERLPPCVARWAGVCEVLEAPGRVGHVQFRCWALQFVGLTYLLTMPTINSHPEPIWCCSQTSSNPRNSLLNDFANPACCRTRGVRRCTGNVVGIVAAAHDWIPARKMAGFLKMIESFDNSEKCSQVVGTTYFICLERSLSGSMKLPQRISTAFSIS
jgi:hypothetical protein